MNCALGGAIRPNGWNAGPGDHGANKDDCASLLVTHVGEDRASEVQCAEDIRLKLDEPVLVTIVGEGFELASGDTHMYRYIPVKRVAYLVSSMVPNCT